MDKQYSFCIEYCSDLSNGLDSNAGSGGRQLLNWTKCLSQFGHLVDIYTSEDISKIPLDKINQNIRFYNLGSYDGRLYDVSFWLGWGYDYCPYRSKLYIYTEWLKNWILRPNQVHYLKKDNTIIGYPFLSYKNLFETDKDFGDKAHFVPYPLYSEFGSIDGYSNNDWTISLRFQHNEIIQKNIETLKVIMNQKAISYQKTWVPFPIKVPLTTILKTMDTLNLVFPLYGGGSPVEAIVKGVIPLPILYSPDQQPDGQALRPPIEKADMLLEWPVHPDLLGEKIDFLMNSKENYMHVLNVYRDYFKDHRFEESYIRLINIIKDRIG